MKRTPFSSYVDHHLGSRLHESDDRLRDQGYTTLTLYQLEGYVRNKINLPARAVAITFDDGLKSVNRYAYPVLKQYGFHATAFIISSRISAIRRSGIRNPCSL